MELRDFIDFADRQNWIFAKNYAEKAPHEYIVKDTLDEKDKLLFSKIVKFMRYSGFPALFCGQEHIYFYYDGNYYWTMGDSVEETIIINRCDYKLYEMCYRGKGIE